MPTNMYGGTQNQMQGALQRGRRRNMAGQALGQRAQGAWNRPAQPMAPAGPTGPPIGMGSVNPMGDIGRNLQVQRAAGVFDRPGAGAPPPIPPRPAIDMGQFNRGSVGLPPAGVGAPPSGIGAPPGLDPRWGARPDFGNIIAAANAQRDALRAGGGVSGPGLPPAGKTMPSFTRPAMPNPGMGSVNPMGGLASPDMGMQRRYAMLQGMQRPGMM